MNKAYDVYNLDEDLDDILEDIANEYDEPIPFIRECYEWLIDREGFLDYIKRSDDGLFYSCLFDLVSRRVLAENKIAKALIDDEICGSKTDDLYEYYSIETIEESVDNSIYNNYGLDAIDYLSPKFQKKLGVDRDRLTYEEFGTARGKRVLFKGGKPKDE